MIAFVCAGLAAQGGSAQALVARLADLLGRNIGLLLVACGTAIVTVVVAAFLGAWLSSYLQGFERALLVAIPMAVAGLLHFRPLAQPVILEPTRSLGAMALVLLGKQISDPARLVVFASAAALSAPEHAAVGGGAGVALALLAGWWFGARAGQAKAWSWLRKLTGCVFILASVSIAWIGHAYG